MKAKKINDVITDKGKLKRSLNFKDVKDELTNTSTGLGFHEPTQTWWGYSHRAAYGFGIGSKVKKGDCAYVSDTHDGYEDEEISWWTDRYMDDIKIQNRNKDGFDIVATYNDKTPNEKLRGTKYIKHCKYPKKGRGEWTAKTLDDAKEMAQTFADSVS